MASIPIGRIIEKEDEYLFRNDYAGAERHLLYWWTEAEGCKDERGKLVLCNELMGLNRKLGRGEKAKDFAGKALRITEEQGLTNTVSGATAYLNCGTVYKAFGEPEKSLEYFRQAQSVYENSPDIEPERMSGLYNNMALTLVDLKRFEEARGYYAEAIAITEKDDPASAAITWLNIADCIILEKGSESAEQEINKCLYTAETLLDSVSESVWDGGYAYVCEKCAPVFSYYGFFEASEKLEQRSAEIYKKYQNK